MSADTASLRALAQSVLMGVQRLEAAGAEAADDSYAGTRLAVISSAALNDADSAVWALVDHIEAGRKN